MKNMEFLPHTLHRTNRRGLSEVIATLLIILLSVALIAVLAQFLIPFVKNNLNKSTECFGYSDYFSFQEAFSSRSGDLRYNCNSGNLTGFSIKAGSSNDSRSGLIGFDMVLIGEGSSKKLSVRDALPKSSELRMLNSSIASVNVPLPGETRTYVHQKQADEGQYVSMEIYPVLKSGRVCEINDKIKLESCSATLSLSP